MNVNQADGSAKDEVVLTGSNVPDTQPVPTKNRSKTVAVSTLINAASVAGNGNTGVFMFDGQGATQIFLLINSDQLWHANTTQPFSTVLDGFNGKYLYPAIGANNQAAVPTISYPKVAIFSWANVLGVSPSVADAMTGAASWSAADIGQDMGVAIYNDSATVATVTVRVIRIWR